MSLRCLSRPLTCSQMPARAMSGSAAAGAAGRSARSGRRPCPAPRGGRPRASSSEGRGASCPGPRRSPRHGPARFPRRCSRRPCRWRRPARFHSAGLRSRAGRAGTAFRLRPPAPRRRPACRRRGGSRSGSKPISRAWRRSCGPRNRRGARDSGRRCRRHRDGRGGAKTKDMDHPSDAGLSENGKARGAARSVGARFAPDAQRPAPGGRNS